jgi:phenylacetic acid degradation operon negative regulatory protein
MSKRETRIRRPLRPGTLSLMRIETSAPADRVRLRPLSARSVVLSLLLGMHPPELPVRDLVHTVAPFGVADSTVRAALSRMVTAGDLHRTDTVYRLSDRLLDRQRRVDAAVHPETRSWDGDWELIVVTATGRGSAERAELRAQLSGLRLAELREGVWLRPANLQRPWPGWLADVTGYFTTRPEQPAPALAAGLWALEEWAQTANHLLAHYVTVHQPADRFAVAAAMVRHLLTDPVLPDELLPAAWPGPALRSAYAGYQGEMAESLRTGRPEITR